jgi:hypothetical protein
VQDARDEGRGGVEEAQVRFQREPMRGGGREGGPKDRVVVGEEREEDPKEEGRCCGRKYQQQDQIVGTRHLRQTIMKVAKEEDGIVADWQGLAMWELESGQERGRVVCADNVLLFSRCQVLGVTNELRASKDKLQGL